MQCKATMVHLSRLPPLPEMQLINTSEVLYNVLQDTRTQEMMANLITTTTPGELALFYHSVLCSMPRSTLIKAIKNKQLQSFPGLTYELIYKYLSNQPATDKCHMICKQLGVQSKK